jgi:hypothetical protein
MKTSTVFRTILVTTAFLLAAISDTHSQTVKYGISASGNVITIGVKSTVNYTANYLTDAFITIRWLNNYGVTLGAVNSNIYFMVKSGPEYVQGIFKYQKFDFNGGSIAINWTANTEYPIMSIPVNQTGSGAGNFELVPIGDFPNGDPFIKIDSHDRTDYTTPFYNNITNDVPLPVELTSFTMSMDNLGATLNWKTATEKNNAGFEIERAAAGPQEKKEWVKVGYVEGSGTSNSPKEYSFKNKNVQTGTYAFRLKQIDRDGGFTYSKEIEAIVAPPREFTLSQNYPNPFNPSTTINYTLAEDSRVSVIVYDIVGRETATLVDGDASAGYYNLSFDARALASGVYLYRITAKHAQSVYTETKRLMLMK